MSDEKKPELKDKPLKDFNKEFLEKQIAICNSLVQQDLQKIEELRVSVERNRGIIGFSQHLLAGFKIPTAPQPDKKPLEVK